MLNDEKLLKAGNTSAFLVLFVFVFIVITTLTFEWYRIFTVKEYIDTEMSRALNIAVDTALLDEYRMVHISKIDVDIAKDTFRRYLHQEMQLNNSNERWEDGKLYYRIIIQDELLDESPAKYVVSGVISIKPALLGRLATYIDIPFKQTSRNQRYE